MDTGRKRVYWLILVLTGALTVLYVERRHLVTRYLDHEQAVQQLGVAYQQCEKLENDISVKRQLVKDLRTDPLEIEAAIRRSKGLVREGETVYRVEQAPDSKAAAAGKTP